MSYALYVSPVHLKWWWWSKTAHETLLMSRSTNMGAFGVTTQWDQPNVEKSAIEEWFAHKLTSPLNGESLTSRVVLFRITIFVLKFKNGAITILYLHNIFRYFKFFNCRAVQSDDKSNNTLLKSCRCSGEAPKVYIMDLWSIPRCILNKIGSSCIPKTYDKSTY